MADMKRVYHLAEKSTKNSWRKRGYKELEMDAIKHYSRPESYTIFLTRINEYFWLNKPYETSYDKGDYISNVVSKHLKRISSIYAIFNIAANILNETSDNETLNHMVRTQMYVKEMTLYLMKNKKYGKIISKEAAELIVASALIHDIGKIGIPLDILMKNGKLVTDELEIIKTHTFMGHESILYAEKLMGEDEKFLKHAKEMSCYHHERWDGGGYPDGLSGYNIPISARIMAVADVYDALTSERAYKNVIEHDAAVKQIIEESGKHFDPEIVNIFVGLNQKFKVIRENTN